MKTSLQSVIDATAKDGRRRFVLHLDVDTTGPVSVPLTVKVEGDHRGIAVWPEGDRSYDHP